MLSPWRYPVTRSCGVSLRRVVAALPFAAASPALQASGAAALEPISAIWWTAGGCALLAAGVLGGWTWARSRGPAKRQELTDFLPAQVFDLDLTGVQALLAAERLAGVSDFVARLRDKPDLLDRCRSAVRIRAANPAALAALGGNSLAAAEQALQGAPPAPFREMFHYQLTSLWAGRAAVEDEYEFTDASGQPRVWFMQCVFPAAAAGQGGAIDGRASASAGENFAFSRALVYVLDVSATRRGMASRLEDFSELRSILAQANILLWGAKVRRENNSFQWKIHVPPHSIDSPLYRLATSIDKGGLWDHGCTPDFERMRATAEEALANGLPRYQHEFRLVTGPRTYWLGEDVTLQKLGEHEWGLVGIVSDITARREAEHARETTEAQLAQLLTRADCLVWQATVQGRSDGSAVWDLYVPQSILHERLFGPRPGPRRALHWDELRVPELSDMHERCWRSLHDGSPGYDQEFRAYRGEQMFWLHEQVSIERAADDRWLLVGVIIDITGRRAAESALAAEKERLAVTLRAMEEAVVTTDTHGRVQFINRAATGFTRNDERAAVGASLAELLSFHDATSSTPLALPLHEVTGHGTNYELPANAALRDRSGAERLVAGCCAPVRDAHSEIIGTVLVFRDITDRQRLAAELQQASKLESVGLLAGGIAHDFNNILTAILGNLTLAMMEAKGLAFIERSLNEAQKATTRARDLTQQLLTFAKGGDPVRTAVHLPGVVVEVSQFALHGTKVKCEYDLPSDLWPADADKGQVGQIVQNLVINATQAMPDGGLIRIVAHNQALTAPGLLPLPPGDFIKISVVDNGPGIPAAHLAKVFDPYFTTKKGGSGLGLATEFSIVRRHRGHVEVESVTGKGATFHIWLPALRGAAAASLPHAQRAIAPLSGRVLFMDDEIPIREMAARLLVRLGLEVETAANGQEALELYAAARTEGRPFDVVVMDLTVPGGMGGQEALQRLRAIDPQVRAIVSSGYSSDPVMSNHRAFGFQGVVRKPYELQEFSSALQSVLRGAG